ncbi:hypothetical protein OEZ85_013144 [Tetradesmus obliquus]|uniref:Uncharacterized protein n=1 Tax=Tetradesmus obliquus TaxID=3088 RepID=A0ABY8U5H0_TETOB|nr:hypothetical protein OEZ85_013144 [Tetradesmus obliquus]
MPTDKRLYPLNECNIGIWGTPDKKRTYLLLLPEKKLFVILLTRDLDAQGRRKDTSVSLNALLCWLRSQVSLWLRHKNPFVDHVQAPHSDTSVLAFEVRWADVVGMDFAWRLTEDARLVLEAATLAKRVFSDVEAP